MNDAFGASHRAHASIVGPPRYVPSAMGRLLQREVEVLLGLRTSPKRPFVAVLGGAKVSDKLGVIDALLEHVDALVVGGAMAFTFFLAEGTSIGDSLSEPDRVDDCRRLLAAPPSRRKPIHLPSDIVGLDADGEVATYGTKLPAGCQGSRHRSRLGRRLRRRDHRRPDSLLERPDGHVRGPAVRRRDACGRRGGGGHQGVHRRRWRRLGRGPRPVRPRHRGRPRVDRWRCVARAPRAGRPARPGGASSGTAMA